MIKNYLTQNSKISKMSGAKTYSWGIPAYLTCPSAGACAKGCYGRQGCYNFRRVKSVQRERLELSLSVQFVEVICAEIKRRNIKRIRIHDTGDFYSFEYVLKWMKIAQLNPQVIFYAYTKEVEMFKDHLIPPFNFTVIYSFGGTQDAYINTTTDRHSRVFASKAELEAEGYTDCSKDDALIFATKKVGLVYHGISSKKWATPKTYYTIGLPSFA